jgi:hypothetical protein
MAGGRPTSYSPEIIPLTEEYLEKCQDAEDEFHSTRGEKSDGYQRILRVKLPTIEGLAVHLGVDRKTIYEWESVHKEFFHIIERLRTKQAEALINNGLSGDYNPVISKVLLTKHGYIEKKETDITSKGESLAVPSSDIEEIAKRVSEELKAKHLKNGNKQEATGDTKSNLS